MKVLDMYMRQSSPPVYSAHQDTGTPVPTKAYQALLMTVELRYESFTPNAIHKPLDDTEFSERNQWLLHVLLFGFLEQLPQYSTVVAFEVLLSVYIIWTMGNLLLKYKGSRPLFRPLWTADSLAGFWTDTWFVYTIIFRLSHHLQRIPCLYIPGYNSLLPIPNIISTGTMSSLHHVTLSPTRPFATFYLKSVFHRQ